MLLIHGETKEDIRLFDSIENVLLYKNEDKVTHSTELNKYAKKSGSKVDLQSKFKDWLWLE